MQRRGGDEVCAWQLCHSHQHGVVVELPLDAATQTTQCRHSKEVCASWATSSPPSCAHQVMWGRERRMSSTAACFLCSVRTVDGGRAVRLCRSMVQVQCAAASTSRWCSACLDASHARQCCSRQCAYKWVVSLKLEDSRTLRKTKLVSGAVVGASPPCHSCHCADCRFGVVPTVTVERVRGPSDSVHCSLP